MRLQLAQAAGVMEGICTASEIWVCLFTAGVLLGKDILKSYNMGISPFVIERL